MAGSTWPTLLAGRKASASEVEAKFDWLEGHIVPQSAGNTTDAGFDLGSTASRWNKYYGANDIELSQVGAVAGSTPRIQFLTGLTTTRGYIEGDAITVGDIKIQGEGSQPIRMQEDGGSLNIRGDVNFHQSGAVVGSTPRLQWQTASGTANRAWIEGDFATLGDLTIQTEGNNDVAINPTGSGALVVGTTASDGNSQLEVNGTKALKIPRLSTAQRDALTAAEGMIVYNSSTARFNFREGTSWNSLDVLPAFKANMEGNQIVDTLTSVKVSINTTTVNRLTTYDTTNFRFTPSATGIYILHARLKLAAFGGGSLGIILKQNGSAGSTIDQRGYLDHELTAGSFLELNSVIDVTNSTDYYEIFVTPNTNSGNTIEGVTNTVDSVFSGVGIRT